MNNRTALLLGATGLVGRHCLDLLLADATYEAVVTLGRRRLKRSHPKLTHHVVDFDRLADAASLIEAHDVFCCLGTTMKKAGSKEAFRKVDFDYPVATARIAAANDAEQYLLVSALGANARSRFFYNRVKGEVEQAIGAFAFDGVYVLRPSLITGDRKEARTGEQASEWVLKAVSFVLRGPLRKYRPIEARTIARAMVAMARRRPGGVRVIESDQIPAEAG